MAAFVFIVVFFYLWRRQTRAKRVMSVIGHYYYSQAMGGKQQLAKCKANKFFPLSILLLYNYYYYFQHCFCPCCDLQMSSKVQNVIQIDRGSLFDHHHQYRCYIKSEYNFNFSDYQASGQVPNVFEMHNKKRATDDTKTDCIIRVTNNFIIVIIITHSLLTRIVHCFFFSTLFCNLSIVDICCRVSHSNKVQF